MADTSTDNSYQTVENKPGMRQHRPHKGNYGVCAPQSVAGDQRAMISRPFATLAFLLTNASGVLTPSRANGVAPGDAAYLVGSAGLSERGTDLGIADTLTRHETSFFAEGYPFRDYEFVMRGIAIVPEGKFFRSAGPINSSYAVSVGGDAKQTGGLMGIIEPMSTILTDSVVNLFFQTMSVQLGFKSESARWDLATPLFLPGGLGLDNSSVPSNGVPVGGKSLNLPFEVQLPRANNRGVSVAQFLFRQELAANIVNSASTFQTDGVAFGVNNTAPDSTTFGQFFKIVLLGDRLCAGDEVAILAERYGCSIDAAQKMAEDLRK